MYDHLHDLIALLEDIILFPQVIELHNNASRVARIYHASQADNMVFHIQTCLGFQLSEKPFRDRNMYSCVDCCRSSHWDLYRNMSSQIISGIGFMRLLW